MSFPKYKEIEEPLLGAIAQRGGEVRPDPELYQAVARYFPQLTPQDFAMKQPSGKDNKWNNMVAWARMYLVGNGELDNAVRGVWRITDKGRKRIGLGTGLQTSVLPEPPLPPPPAPPPRRHEELKQMMVDIGKALGYHTSTEESHVYRHDVLWRPGGKPYINPICVIEVCEGGSLPKDFDSLHWASDNWGARGILVVTDDKDYQKATQRFINRSEICAVMASTVVHLHELISSDEEFFKWLFEKR